MGKISNPRDRYTVPGYAAAVLLLLIGALGCGNDPQPSLEEQIKLLEAKATLEAPAEKDTQQTAAPVSKNFKYAAIKNRIIPLATNIEEAGNFITVTCEGASFQMQKIADRDEAYYVDADGYRSIDFQLSTNYSRIGNTLYLRDETCFHVVRPGQTYKILQQKFPNAKIPPVPRVGDIILL